MVLAFICLFLKYAGANAADWTRPEWDKPPAQIQVGDRVELVARADGVDWAALGPLSARIATGAGGAAEGSGGDDTEAAEAPDFLEKGWYLLAVEGMDAAGKPGLRVRVAPLKPGDTLLPALEIVNSAGEVIARTAPLRMKVQGAEGDAPPRPLVDPLDLSLPTWVKVLAALGVVLALAALAFWIRKRRRGKPAPPPPPEVVLSPEDELREALTRLERQALWRQGRHKEYYFGVSEAVKHYLGRRYGFDAEESTSAELAEQLRARVASIAGGEQRIEQVAVLFQKLDLVKFTDHVPTDADAGAVLREAQGLAATAEARGEAHGGADAV